MNLRPELVSQILVNWKLRNSGRGPMSVDEFIYRIEVLTYQTLGGNFELLTRYIGNLFEGSASDWYWRYQKSARNIEWPEFKRALLVQFKDKRTDVNIRAAIDRRMQKQN